jgi:hypothetical protein
VYPGAADQFALRWASRHGYVEIVKLLLPDTRVDPSADNQYAIRHASRSGRVDVVKLLLADQRVDPSANNQFALRSAFQGGCVDVAKLLLSDPRVDIPSDCNTSDLSVEVLSLFLLRRSSRLQWTEESKLALSSVVADLEKIESQRKTLLDDHLLSDLSALCLAYVPDLFCHLDDKISTLIDTSHSKYPRFSFGCLSTL